MAVADVTNSSLDITYVVYVNGDRKIVMESDISEGFAPDDEIKISTQDGDEFVLFTDRETAGRTAMERWEEMADNSPDEVVELIGADVLIAWALGKSAGPGSEAANSFQEWLEDVVAEHPEEEFATYDGVERDFVCKHPDLSHYSVAYRVG